MLLLTRNIGQTIVISDDIKVAVLGIKGNQVRLGIEAPREVIVNREELQQRIQKELDTETVLRR